jgi:hypothetical protein
MQHATAYRSLLEALRDTPPDAYPTPPAALAGRAG